MVQTRAGAKRSEWLQFIAEMSVLYRQRQLCTKEALEAAANAQKEVVTDRRRRRRPPKSQQLPSGSGNAPTDAIPSGSPDTSYPAEA